MAAQTRISCPPLPAQAAVTAHLNCCATSDTSPNFGLNILPAELLSRHNLNLETIIQPKSGNAGTMFFTELFEQLHKDIQTCLTKLQGKDAGNLLFSITLLNILSALCREYQTTTQHITHTRISLTPIRKLWIAWRTARHSGL